MHESVRDECGKTRCCAMATYIRQTKAIRNVGRAFVRNFCTSHHRFPRPAGRPPRGTACEFIFIVRACMQAYMCVCVCTRLHDARNYAVETVHRPFGRAEKRSADGKRKAFADEGITSRESRYSHLPRRESHSVESKEMFIRPNKPLIDTTKQLNRN